MYGMVEKRFLITTADEHTWRTDVPVLFLGEWCRLYNRAAAWKDLDAEIVPYHWDDREKLHRDYLYLKALHEKLLQELSAQLNEQHGVEHSLRYWRILIGPWLGYFVHMLFDRWSMLEKAIKNYSIAGVQILDVMPDGLIPNNMNHFHDLFFDDAWNEMIYGQLLQNWTAIPITKIPTSPARSFTATSASLTLLLKRQFAQALSVASQWLVRNNEAFFIATYLPLKLDWKLQYRLGQIPKLWRQFQPPRTEISWGRRQWKMSQMSSDMFANIARTMIPQHIPASYLEGYSALQSFCINLPWPKKPRFIFTSNSYHSDDVFKAWAAEKIETGTPLVVGQHGGVFGIARWMFVEDHQVAISDYWLSWGWEDKKNNHIKPVGNLKMVGRNLSCNPEGGALMVEMAMPRYSHYLYSAPVASQWLEYFQDQCRFASALPGHLRTQLLVRLYGADYGWCQKQRWQERFSDIHLDNGIIPIDRLIEKSRIYISTYNATTFLESLTTNIPTIIFWNPKYCELRESAIPYFEQLKRAGIFHETPESAAHQMALIWDNVTDWWSSEHVQTARKEFCYRYSRVSEQLLEDIEQVLRQSAQKS